MKPWYASKTLWVNVLMMVGLILTATDVLAVVPKEMLPYVGAANAVVNIVLRVWFTREGITGGPSAPPYQGTSA